MECRDFERNLEALADGRLPESVAVDCRSHAQSCEGCGELLALISLPQPGEVDELTSEVLTQTVGSACAQARERVCEQLDGGMAAADLELIELHLGGCTECRQLQSVLVRLRRELPTLAERAPDPRFLQDVLAATLPVSIQLRRWWRGAWPALVRRPRFALEGAYVGLLAVILVLTTVGAPVEAMPQRAIELSQRQPQRWTEAVTELGEKVDSRVAAVKASDAMVKLHAQRELAGEKAEQAKQLWATTRERVGTLWNEAASLLERSNEEKTSELEQSPSNPTEE